MSYATIDEVKSLFRNLVPTANAAVTDAEIQLFLDNGTAVIDAKLGTLYTLPIDEGTMPESWKILKQINMFQGAAIVDDILNSYGEADKKPMWGSKAKELMKALVPEPKGKSCKQCEPTMILPDAPYIGTKQKRGRLQVSATSGTVFKKNSDNW